MRDVLRAGLGPDQAEVHAWFRDHWAGRGEYSLAFFHRWSLDPETTLDAWFEEHEFALKNRQIDKARTLLDDWSEIALDGLIASGWATRSGRGLTSALAARSGPHQPRPGAGPERRHRPLRGSA